MKVLLSIKPEYVKRIFEGKKKYEYRRSLFKREDIESIVIYATKPVGKVVGEFQIETIIEDDPRIIWEKTKSYSGIKKKDYMNYFDKKEKGFAIVIKDAFIYDTPLELNELNPQITTAPQSFRYIF